LGVAEIGASLVERLAQHRQDELEVPP
jgi:hypothetical protein